MSTRSMVVIQNTHARSGGHVTLYLYRHCDGYPAGAGETLNRILDEAGEHPDAASVASRLLAERYEGQRGRPVYELADWTPEQQGDLEWVYVVSCGNSCVEVTVRERVDRFQGDEKWVHHPMSRERFREYVAEHVAAYEARVAAYHARRSAES